MPRMASRISRSIHQSRPLIIDYDEGLHERDAKNHVLIHPRETPSIILIKASDSAPRIETANNSCPITLLRPQPCATGGYARASRSATPEISGGNPQDSRKSGGRESPARGNCCNSSRAGPAFFPTPEKKLACSPK